MRCGSISGKISEWIKTKTQALSRQVEAEPDRIGTEVPNSSEGALSVPNVTEEFSEPIPFPVARTSAHTLTVHEVSRLFEIAGVPITEKTVTNWCHHDKQGARRLDGVYDETDRRWYITPLSVDAAITVERFRKRQNVPSPISETAEILSEHYGQFPNDASEHFEPIQKEEATTSEPSRNTVPNNGTPEKTNEPVEGSHDVALEKENALLRQKLFDLEVLNKGKDYFMKEMERMNTEMIDRLETRNHKIGELERSLQLLEGPRSYPAADRGELG